MKKATLGDRVNIPLNVACCPICSEPIYGYIEEIEHHEKGYSVGNCGFKIDCTSEPDLEKIDTFEWEEWFSTHWSMPYVDWLPLEIKMSKWLNNNYQLYL
jgi:hypothetical protein